jgi:hypothetical protein
MKLTGFLIARVPAMGKASLDSTHCDIRDPLHVRHTASLVPAPVGIRSHHVVAKRGIAA